MNYTIICEDFVSVYDCIRCTNCLQYKLCKVKTVQTGPKGIPFLVTHDARTIRYPDPLVKVNDTIQLDIATSKIMDHIRFDSGELVLEFFTNLFYVSCDDGQIDV